MDGLLQAGRHPDPVRGPRRMAQTPVAASAMEGMETSAHPTAQTARPRDLRDERPSMGDLAQGVLAHRRIQSPRRRPPNGYWTDLGLQGFLGPYRRFRDAERTAGCGPARPVVWGARG